MITIRTATPADAAGLARLNAAFNDVHDTPEQIAARLADPRRVETAVLAEVDGRVAGFAVLRVTPTLLYAEPHAELTELYVEPAYRRLGVGRALVETVERMARDAGASSLVVITGFDNPAAQALYRSLGFLNEELTLWKDI